MAKINQEEYEKLKRAKADGYEWIARDEDGDLYAYDVKPERLRYMWLYESGDAIRLAKHEHLFQFIQWEDSEPYNISELIDEYESEEIEVKKDIEWLKEEIWRQDIVMDKGYIYTDDLMSIINELDEPEVLSQEWIDDHAYAVAYDGMPDQTEVVYVDDLQNLLVPKSKEITEEQVIEWLDNNDFYDHRTAETVLANAVDKGELSYYGTKYSVVKKEPETVASVMADFFGAAARLKEVLAMEVEELEENGKD